MTDVRKYSRAYYAGVQIFDRLETVNNEDIPDNVPLCSVLDRITALSYVTLSLNDCPELTVDAQQTELQLSTCRCAYGSLCLIRGTSNEWNDCCAWHGRLSLEVPFVCAHVPVPLQRHTYFRTYVRTRTPRDATLRSIQKCMGHTFCIRSQISSCL